MNRQEHVSCRHETLSLLFSHVPIASLIINPGLSENGEPCFLKSQCTLSALQDSLPHFSSGHNM